MFLVFLPYQITRCVDGRFQLASAMVAPVAMRQFVIPSWMVGPHREWSKSHLPPYLAMSCGRFYPEEEYQ